MWKCTECDRPLDRYYPGSGRKSFSDETPQGVDEYLECLCADEYDELRCPKCEIRELSMGPYGVRYSCCDDCAGDQEPDGEDFRGGEAAAFQAEQQEAARRLK